MAWVVFIRAVNVGGHQVFRPAELARKLAAWDVKNIGAAGTLVVRKPISQRALRAQLKRSLPFEAPLMICAAKDLEQLVSSEPFRRSPAVEGMRRTVSILEKRPLELPHLPLDQPGGEPWQVRILAVQGRFVLALSRRLGKRVLYPNQVVERILGVAATTRTWDTFVKVNRALQTGRE